jgi:hypothetical protein
MRERITRRQRRRQDLQIALGPALGVAYLVVAVFLSFILSGTPLSDLFGWIPSLPTDTSAASQSATATSAPAATTKTPMSSKTTNPPPSGYPHVGGPFSDFVIAYGQPSPNGNGANFFTDSTHTIEIVVGPTNSIVTYMNLVGHTSWSKQQTLEYCIQFLPHDSTAFNSVGPYTDYHTSAGTIAIGVYGQGTATVDLSQ